MKRVFIVFYAVVYRFWNLFKVAFILLKRALIKRIRRSGERVQKAKQNQSELRKEERQVRKALMNMSAILIAAILSVMIFYAYLVIMICTSLGTIKRHPRNWNDVTKTDCGVYEQNIFAHSRRFFQSFRDMPIETDFFFREVDVNELWNEKYLAESSHNFEKKNLLTFSNFWIDNSFFFIIRPFSCLIFIVCIHACVRYDCVFFLLNGLYIHFRECEIYNSFRV